MVTEEVTVDGHTEKRPVMQLVTNRAPLNRAILRASAAIGLGALTLGGHAEEAGEAVAVSVPSSGAESALA